MKRITSRILILSALAGTLFISATQPKPKPKTKPQSKTQQQAKLPVKEKLGAAPQAKPEVKNPMAEITTDYGKMIVKLYNETPLHRDNFIKLAEQGFYDSLLFHRIIKGFMIQGGDPQSKYAMPEMPLGNGDVGYRIPAEFNKNLIHKKGALAAARDDNPAKASSGCQFYIVQGRRFNGKELSDMRNGINFSMKTKLLQEITNSDSVKAKVDDYKLRGDKDGLHNYMLSLQPIIDEMYSKMEFSFSPYQMSAYTTMGGAPHLDMGYTVFGEVVEGLNVLDSIASVKTGQFDRPVKDLRMKVRMIK